jgi:hypothetical protein
MAKKKYIDPNGLEKYWEDYKLYVKTHPDYVSQMTVKGELVYVPKEKPLQLNEFEAYLSRQMEADGYENPLSTLRHYRDNKNGSYEEYCQVVTRIEKDWESDNVGGVMTGKFTAANLVARIHNLKEQSEVNTNANINILNIDPLADGE